MQILAANVWRIFCQSMRSYLSLSELWCNKMQARAYDLCTHTRIKLQNAITNQASFSPGGGLLLRWGVCPWPRWLKLSLQIWWETRTETWWGRAQAGQTQVQASQAGSELTWRKLSDICQQKRRWNINPQNQNVTKNLHLAIFCGEFHQRSPKSSGQMQSAGTGRGDHLRRSWRAWRHWLGKKNFKFILSASNPSPENGPSSARAVHKHVRV